MNSTKAANRHATRAADNRLRGLLPKLVLNKAANAMQQIPIKGACMRLMHSARQPAFQPCGSGSMKPAPTATKRDE
jgi:hypothetical protein